MKPGKQIGPWLLTIAIWLAVSLLPLAAISQLSFGYQAGTFLIKGKVADIQTKDALPFTTISVNGVKKIQCDNAGNFTLYVAATDTLKFSCTGYINKTIHVADLDSNTYYTLEILLPHDVIKIKEVTIYPYRNLQEFKDAFVQAKDVNKIILPGVAAPKYSNKIPRAKLTNPISFLYDKVRHRSVANPDFKP